LFVAALNQLLNFVFVFTPRCAQCQELIRIGSSRRICASCHDRIEGIKAPICFRCGVPLNPASANALCGDCLAHPPNLAVARAIGSCHASSEQGERVLRPVVAKHKSGLSQALGPTSVESLEDLHPEVIQKYDIVFGCRCTRAPDRILPGGTALAKVAAKKVGCELDSEMATTDRPRRRPTSNMTSGPRNVRRSSAVKRRESIVGRRIVLVDDAMTMGTPLAQCAGVPLEAGASMRGAFALARAQ
jgi:predicted amidophosphoribosyltransferase